MPPRTDPVEVGTSDGKIRCVLVHDYVLFRQGLRRLLDDEPDIEVISEAGNAAEGLRKVHELRPDVVVADAGMFGLPASEAETCVARESPHTKLVFVSTQEQPPSLSGGFRVAPGDFAARQISAEELVKMVRNSCSGDRVHHRDAFTAYDRLPPTDARFPRQQPLTAREREVMKLLAEGKTVRASALILGLSIKTVDAHKFNLMRKLGVHNKAELVMRAIQNKVVKIPANF